MAISFRSVLKAFRVRAGIPLAYNYPNNTNADLSCDSDGNLFVSLASAILPTPGAALPYSASFSSGAMVTDYVPVLGGPFGVAPAVALQYVQAHAAVPNTYLMVFNSVLIPVDGTLPLYAWPVPTTGYQLQVGWPYGLRVGTGGGGGPTVNLHFVFSATSGVLTSGPLGFLQGVFSLGP